MTESARPRHAQASHEDISQRAYAKYLARGAGGYGFDLQDWFEAEAELRGPISTAAEEAAIRGAEAEAAQAKRAAELGGNLPPEARALMTDVGESIPRQGSAGSQAPASRPRQPRKTGATAQETTTDLNAGGNEAPDASALMTDVGASIPRKGRWAKKSVLASRTDEPSTNSKKQAPSPESASL